jgi:hypothetical protein
MKPRKLLERLLAGHMANVAFADFLELATAFGFELVRTAGSHHILRHPHVNELLSLQPLRGEAKPYQIRQLLHLVESYNLRFEGEA